MRNLASVFQRLGTEIRRGGDLPSQLILLSRFGIAGIANTAVGFGIIAALDIGMHVRPALANAIGYGFGIILGFVLNRNYVYRSNASVAASGPRYVLVVALAFGLNQAVLAIAGYVLGSAPVARVTAQLIAMGVYTVAVFVLCRIWIFKATQQIDVN